jgi:chromosome segregation ATPase
MCIGKTIFRTALLGGLVVGGATLLLGPHRMAAGFHTVRANIQDVVDSCTDDPMALRRQLQAIADELPEKIGELRAEINQVDRQIAQMTRDSEIAQGVVAMTSDHLEDLDVLLTRATATRESTGQIVQVRFKARRYNISSARNEFNRIGQIRETYRDRLANNVRDLEYLQEQKDRLVDLLGKMEQEEATIDAQMWQIDRKIEAIARNEKLVDRLEEREKSFSEFDSTFDFSSLEQLQARLDEWETKVQARLERFDRRADNKSYENEVKWQLEQQGTDEWDADEFDNESDSVVFRPQVIDLD